MQEVLTLADAGTAPGRSAVLRSQGIPEGVEPRERVLRLVDGARSLYATLADPRALYIEVSEPEFEAVYRGEGLNAHPTPLERIVPRAERLALFAVTLGEAVSLAIAELFGRNEPALATVLDAIASERADRAAELLAARYRDRLVADGRSTASVRVLAYSPGYCGWHVTGQRRLFDRLQPGRIGVTLNSSCLMQPLKTVSGVLVAGAPDVHDFDNAYDFCGACSAQPCRARIASLADG